MSQKASLKEKILSGGVHFHRKFKENTLCLEMLYRHVPEIRDKFEITEKLGEGTFSSVYKARLRTHPEINVALKHIYQTANPIRTDVETKCLKHIRYVNRQ